MNYEQRLDRIERAMSPRRHFIWRHVGETAGAAIERYAREHGTTPAALEGAYQATVIGWQT